MTAARRMSPGAAITPGPTSASHLLLLAAALFAPPSPCAGDLIVIASWSNVTRTLATLPTLQVVPTPLFERGSATHDAIWAALAALNASRVRFVPWLPFPRLGVAELEPPSGGALCGFRASSAPSGDYYPLTLSCGGASTIADVDFAAYGESSGYCGNLSAGACVLPGSAAVVRAACVGKRACTIFATDEFFGGSPGCASGAASLAVQLRCGDAALQHSSWDFARMDGLVEDFMAAQGSAPDGSVSRADAVILNPSTPPQFLYSLGPNRRLAFPDNPSEVTWSYEQGGPGNMVDPSGRAIGDYFGRVFAHYAAGGFRDEYGTFFPSPYNYSIPAWEVLNEPDDEHSHTPESYTAIYDAITAGLAREAPEAAARVRFVGLALSAPLRELDFFSHFLNSSNHVAGAPRPASASFHFYAAPPTRGEPAEWGAAMFGQADSFAAGVEKIVAIRDALAPGTALDVDEMGVILPDDNSDRWTTYDFGFPAAPFWSATAAFSAYAFVKLAALGVNTVGMSALCCHPAMPELGIGAFYPSVAILNWSNAERTQRYWGLKLLLDTLQQGDAMVASAVTQAAAPDGGDGAAAPFCGTASYPDSLSLSCTAPGATIAAIDFASYGRPLGGCGTFSVNASCHAVNSSAILAAACIGRAACNVTADTAVFSDPCYGDWKFLAVEAHCSTGGGAGASSAGPSVFAQAFSRAAPAARRVVLVVNTAWIPASVTLPGAAGGLWQYTDAESGVEGYAATTLDADTWALAPWAAGFVTLLPGSSARQ